MTRINLIAPQKLSDQHLLAEHREIKRIPNVILSGNYSFKGQPNEFTLWAGHVKFFYDKVGFLLKRYIELYNECIKRGFNVTNYSTTFLAIVLKNWELYNYYIPTPEAIALSEERIQEKLKAKPNFYKWTTLFTYNI